MDAPSSAVTIGRLREERDFIGGKRERERQLGISPKPDNRTTERG